MQYAEKVKYYLQDAIGYPINPEHMGKLHLKNDLALDSLSVIALIAKYMTDLGLPPSKIDPGWLESLHTFSNLEELFKLIGKKATP